MKEIIPAVKKNLAEILVILASLLLLGCFVTAKEGFHMDEIISFEFANAEYNPWIVPTQPEGRLAKFVHNEIDGATPGETFSNLVREVKDVLQNRGSSKLLSYKADVYEEPVWITAQQFKDYITVGKGDAFNYLSVFFNVQGDVHPPLYYMLLHTASSFFRGTANAWSGCFVNLIFVAATMVLLIQIGRRLAAAFGMPQHARAMGICFGLAYGISAGAVSTTLLIRMYGLVTLWCVAFFRLILEKWLDGSFDRKNRKLIFVTMLGFWTQYFFLFYCIPAALVTSVLLLVRKRVRELWRFVRSMLIAAVAGVALFPFAVLDVIYSDRGVEALGNLSEGFSGYGIKLAAFAKILERETFSVAVWIMLAVLMVCWLIIRKGKGEGEKRKFPWGTACLLVLPAVGCFLLTARMSPYLVDRYIMPVFPFVIMTGVSVLFGVVTALEKCALQGRAKGVLPVVFGVTILLQVVSLVRLVDDGSYLYRGYREQEQMAAENSDRSCLCVYTGVGYYENVKEFAHYEKTLLMTMDELRNRIDRESIAAEEEIAVLVKYGVDYSEVLEILSEEYGFELENGDWVSEGPYGDTICLMRKES